MESDSVMADLSDPDPMRTVKERKKAPEAPKPEPAKPQDATPTPEPETDPLEGDEAPPKPEVKAKSDTSPKPEDETITDDEARASKPPAKAGPWKLAKYWEKRAAATEMERNELRDKLSKLPDPTKLEDISKRNAELEEEIRYQNFAKSKEFSEQYQKPYEEAWGKAVAELAELEVLNEDGSSSRRATASDLIALANMPLGEARKQANAMFGDAADDVMAHRRSIRELSDKQQKALEDARKAGTERETQWTEKSKAIHAEVTAQWTKLNEEAAATLDYLKPKEGDTEWNGRLDKAKAQADAALSANAMDPRLTPEQRAKVIRDHVAMRNRSIAYSPMKLEIKRLKAQLAERDEKLKAYEESEPTGGSAGATNGKPQPAATPMERAKQRLHASAVPAPNYF